MAEAQVGVNLSEFKNSDTIAKELNKMPRREFTSRALSASQDRIKQKLNSGFFDGDTDDKKKAKDAAESAVLYEGGEVNDNSSQGLQGIVDSLKTMGEKKDLGLRKVLTDKIKVKVGEGDSEELLTFDQWEQKLQDPALSAEERAKLEKGLLGFDFSEDDAAREAAKPKTPEQIIAVGEEAVRAKIQEKKEKGESIKGEETMLAYLAIASKAEGEWESLLKRGALVGLKKGGYEVEGLDATMNQTNTKDYDPLVDDLGVMMLKTGRFTKEQVEGNVLSIKKNGLGLEDVRMLSKVLPLEQLVFGKSFDEIEFTPEQKTLIDKYFPKDKEKGGGFWQVFLILAYTFGEGMIKSN